MTENVLNTDLTGKVAVVTGAGGVLCSYFAKVLARAGGSAMVNRSEEAIKRFAAEITAEGGIAAAYKGDVCLDKSAMEDIAARVEYNIWSLRYTYKRRRRE